MPPKAKLLGPPPCAASAASVLQNIAIAKEHEEPQTAVRAEPVQTQLDATQEQAEPSAPATMDACVGSAAKMDVDHEDVFCLEIDTLTTFAPADPDAAHGEHVGVCRICKKPVLSTERYTTWVPKGKLHYVRHVECQKMVNTMHGLLSKGCNGRLKDLWVAEPTEEKLKWWHRHPGLTPDQLKTELEAQYGEEIAEARDRIRGYKGVPTDVVTLRKKYLPERQEMFDNIIQNAGRVTCPITGATLYEDPSYENHNVYTERTTQVTKRTAEQTSTVAPKKLKRAEEDAEIKDFNAQLDEVSRKRKSSTRPSLEETLKKKPLTEYIKKKLENIGEKAGEAMDAFEALQQKLTEVATQVPAKSIEILQQAGLDVQSNTAQVDEMIGAGECDARVHSFFKRASEDTAALKKQTKLVGELICQLE